MKKVILVTGASSGIGKSTVLQLVKEGHVVYGAARRLEKMADIVEAGGHAIRMDVADHAQVKTEIQNLIAKEKRIDVLVNNAGFAIWGPVEETSYEDACRQFEVNIFGLAEVTKAVLPAMRGQGSGKIINVSSVGGKTYSPLGAWYHATKHALEGWSDCLRLELKPFKIDVVIIEPGIILTEFDQAMHNPFVEQPDNSPYKKLIKGSQKAQQDAYKPRNSSPPSVIAMLISKAIKAERPKTRYVGGKLAKMILFYRKWFSDKSFDRTILSMLNRMAQA